MLDPLPPTPEDQRFQLNRRALALISGVAVQTDLSERLRTAIQSLPDVDLFEPNWPKYRYVAASTRHIIFAFAIGNHTLALRLDRRFHPQALANGGTAFDECGEDWVSFSACREDGSQTNLDYWAARAYDYARTIGA